VFGSGSLLGSDGVTIPCEMIDAVRLLVRRFHISAPEAQVDIALRTLRESEVNVTA
jgi:hypothetical protein